MVPKADGLRHLQVSESGQDDLNIFLRHVNQCFLQINQQGAYQINLATQPQAHIGGHLIVARAAGVQALAGNANELRQARLNVQMHVFQVQLPLKLAGLNLSRNRRHATLNGRVVLGADDGLVAQHLGMGQ